MGELAWQLYCLQLSQGAFGDANLDGVTTFSDFWHWWGLLFQFPGALFLRYVMFDPGLVTYWEMDGSVTGGWAVFWSCIGWFFLVSFLIDVWGKWQAKQRHEGEGS